MLDKKNNSKIEISVIDYQMGNLYSVCKGIERSGGIPKIITSSTEIKKAKIIVLPGVGSFDPAMKQLKKQDLINPLNEAISEKKPFLGICLGLHLLFEGSEEGAENGLGFLSGSVKKIKNEPEITIPHMGWNQLKLTNPNCYLWSGLTKNPWVYFVHSYFAQPTNYAVEAASVIHGTQEITAAIQFENIAAVQFHPEKSAAIGLHMLKNFVKQDQLY
uniref:Imidazole glycerol phosphate synthase subunit HisH n=1 Tax=Cyanophora biloba TaxID=1489483 RepID=A0A2Z4HGN4_9EUKA|nr:imidazole glycerol phosphate synthase subunit hisH [Cyanophora biloba]AWW13803.1 imidazole glycerol phosphate synthase subunit hisH [Cyanophora biloba]